MSGGSLNGADALLRSLLASGTEVCFANPGTSEMHVVAALDRTYYAAAHVTGNELQEQDG